MMQNNSGEVCATLQLLFFVSTLNSCAFTVRVAFLSGIQVVHNISEHWLLYVEAKCTRYMIQPVALFYGPTWQQLYNYVDFSKMLTLESREQSYCNTHQCALLHWPSIVQMVPTST